MTRTFTILNSCIHKEGGKYKSTSPNGAAKKAASKLFKIAKADPKYKTIRRITFTLRETTKGDNKELFEYKASRVKLPKPIVRIINGKEIVNKYKTVVTSDNHKQIKCKKI